MKKLKHDLKVGDRFNVELWGWQCAQVPQGEYEIVGAIECWDEVRYYQIKQVNGDYTCLIDRRNAEYLAGEEVKPEYNVCYEPEDFQPSGDDICDADFITEEKDAEFGPWYLSSCGDGEHVIHSTMMSSNFAWVKMPW